MQQYPSYGPPTQEMYPRPAGAQTDVAAPKQFSPLAPWVEFIAGCFGFHGIGLIMVGKRGRGIIWLALSLVKHAIGAGLIAATVGAALVCLIPLDIGIAIFLTLAVRRVMRRATQAPALAIP
jgi:hypothetical protein